MQQFDFQYVQLALEQEWPCFFFLLAGSNLRMLNTLTLCMN